MSPPPKNITVLVADDSALIRNSTAHIVRKLGYNPIMAADGNACIELLNTHQIDLLLLDIHMPKKNGIAVLSYIRDHHFTLPIIMISGSSDIEQALDSLKMGAYEFLLKPIDPSRLAVTLKNALSEQYLREKVNLFSAAITQSPLSVVITDQKGIIEYINPAFTAICGYSENEAKGRNMNILKSGKHPAKFYSRLWKTISSGKIWQGELINRNVNGELFWEFATISPITDHTCKISHFLAIKQDITQRKKEQEALYESERRFQELADLLPQPIFEIDLQGIITYTNRIGIETFGYTQEDLERGVSSLMLFAPEDREKVIQNIEYRLKGIPFESHEYNGLRKNGTSFPILVYTARVMRDGKPVGIRGIVLDITARREIEEKLQQLNQTLEQRVEERTRDLEVTHQQMILQEKLASIGQLAAGLAHELNNPINFVRINFATLQDSIGDLQEILNEYQLITKRFEDGTVSNEELQKLHQRETDLAVDSLLDEIPGIFEESRQGFERVTTIIESMRNFSFRHAIQERVLFDINKGIRDTLIIARNEYRYYASVEMKLEDVPPVPCNPEQINQVFLNIIINGAHAIASQQRASNGKISIETRYDDNYVYCTIADDGPGIPVEIRRRIFEPFFTTKEPGKGTGLGLSISYDIIVHKHNGKLDVQCSSDGGTIFTIVLPRKLKSEIK